MHGLNYIDLFAGAGGLSEGFIRKGFKPLAHVELMKTASMTLETRAGFHYLQENNRLDIYYKYLKGEISRADFLDFIPDSIRSSVINKEISFDSISEIFDKIDDLKGKKSVDVIIGGPPCQAYSIVGRARDPKNMADDPRNFLYIHYVDFLKKYKPKMFVFENVPGILSAKNGEYFDKIKKAITKVGYDFEFKILNAQQFGVLQNRKRVILIGWRKELEFSYPEFNWEPIKYNILKDLFPDLPKLQNGEGTLGVIKYAGKTTKYLKETGIRNGIEFTTQHIARPNNTNDLKIYSIAVDLWKQGKKLKYNELPKELIKHKNVTSFNNRFKVVDGYGVSSTVVAHIAADGHYFIHPDGDQNRSITVREAARIQSFPDDFYFEGGRSAAFKQIGNAVPPLMAEGIAEKIKNLLA